MLATGARATVGVPGALTFRDQRDLPRFRHLLNDLDERKLDSLVFAVPSGTSWPLPLYELALLSVARARARRAGVEITLVSREPRPLAAFGAAASQLVAAEAIDTTSSVLLTREPAWRVLRRRLPSPEQSEASRTFDGHHGPQAARGQLFAALDQQTPQPAGAGGERERERSSASCRCSAAHTTADPACAPALMGKILARPLQQLAVAARRRQRRVVNVIRDTEPLGRLPAGPGEATRARARKSPRIAR